MLYVYTMLIIGCLNLIWAFYIFIARGHLSTPIRGVLTISISVFFILVALMSVKNYIKDYTYTFSTQEISVSNRYNDVMKIQLEPVLMFVESKNDGEVPNPIFVQYIITDSYNDETIISFDYVIDKLTPFNEKQKYIYRNNNIKTVSDFWQWINKENNVNICVIANADDETLVIYKRNKETNDWETLGRF